MSTIEKIKKDMKDIDEMLNQLASKNRVVEETKKISKLIQEGLDSPSRLVDVVDEDIWANFERVLEEDKKRKRAFANIEGCVDGSTVDRNVNHPFHYNLHPKGIECIDVVESMSFNIGNAIKYLWRQGFKGDSITDLKKAVWYIQREISKQSNQN